MFVGSREIGVKDEEISFPVLVWYPSRTRGAPTGFGPYEIEVGVNALAAEGRYPLVVVSHGSGGFHLLYRSVCSVLAKSGYVVAMVQHHGNNRNNNELAGSLRNLENRPRHVRLTIDAVSQDSELGSKVASNNVAIIGHSMGGYTALAVAGGKPCSERGESIEVFPDPRVQALVLMAPATAWYRPLNSLSSISIPILIFVGEHDKITPLWHADIVREGVANPEQVKIKMIPIGGHFSFLTPFPAHMKSPHFKPSTDPEGFDREEFHKRLPGMVLEFLDEKLKDR
jgi:predicted dienelactone hydrolase